MQLVLLAAGRGRRLGLAPSKGLVTVNGQLLIRSALAHAAAIGKVSGIVVVANHDAADGMRRAIDDTQSSVIPDLIAATTASAFESLLVACRSAPSSGSTVVGMVDSLVSSLAVRALARSPGDGCLLVRPGSDPGALHVAANAEGQVVAVGAQGVGLPSNPLISAGWLVFRGDLRVEAEAAWLGGVRMLRDFQASLVAKFDVRCVVTDHGYDIDTPEDLELAEREAADERGR